MANRVAAIHEGSEPPQWRCVDTKINPADDASKGLNGDQMLENERWLYGPSFLKKSKEFWLSQPTNIPQLANDDEIKKEVHVHQVTVHESPVDKFFQRYSSWYKLKKAAALLRFKIYIMSNMEVKMRG